MRIEATDLPGRRFLTSDGGSSERATCGTAYDNVHVGVQRRSPSTDLLDPHPGDAAQATWEFDAVVTDTAAGADVSGPYVQGRRGERFVYLSWGTVDERGAVTMFRRAKLLFADVDPEVLAAGRRSGRLVARLGLTDAKGEPLCARVRPPHVEWSAG